MATFDKLSAEQQAIIELVLQRGQTYEGLSGMLGMPASRVRELAREALSELSPNTASRVDDDWRAQLSDYLLGQQSGPESIATRGHLKRSEPARTWALSVLDSLDSLYENGTRPVIPESDAPATAVKEPRRKEPEPEPVAAAQEDEVEEKPERPRKQLSADARRVVLRRRILAGVLAVAAIAAVLIFVVGIFDSDDKGGDNASANASNQNQGTLVLHQALLRSRGGEKGAGIAVMGRTQGRLVIQVTASSLKPTGKNEAYAVWLYNSKKDSRLVAAQQTDDQGRFVAVGALPDNYANYKNVDVSRQDIQGSTKHSGDSVLRGGLQAVPKDQQQQQQQQQQPGG